MSLESIRSNHWHAKVPFGSNGYADKAYGPGTYRRYGDAVWPRTDAKNSFVSHRPVQVLRRNAMVPAYPCQPTRNLPVSVVHNVSTLSKWASFIQ